MLQGPRRNCVGAAMGAIALHLRPGLGIGAFSIGMPICDAFARIEEQPNIYDVFHVKYSDEDPLELDIVLSFPDHGFHLRFDPLSQLRFCFRGPSTPTTFVAVYALFGPTFPGIYDKDRAAYNLFYPGLSFTFPVPTKYTECFCNGEAALPLEFPDGTTPITSRICIYDSSTDSKVGVGSLLRKASVPPLPAGCLYMEEVYAKLGEQVWFTVGGQRICFGASPQDVWTDLGRPCGIHKKEVDQMGIHSASDLGLGTTLSGDYFYIYFACGFDILFDGKEIFGDCGQAANQIRGSSSPFGSTSVYGYPNVAFEVMKNGYIATVTLLMECKRGCKWGVYSLTRAG